jgi:hypothetical protein
MFAVRTLTAASSLDNVMSICDSEPWEPRTDRISDVALSKMGVVLLSRPCVGMAELLRDDGHGCSTHCESRPISVSERME